MQKAERHNDNANDHKWLNNCQQSSIVVIFIHCFHCSPKSSISLAALFFSAKKKVIYI